MSLHPLKAETTARGARMLRTAFGPGIAAWLEDPSVVEVMLNPDGRLWIDRLTYGLADTGRCLSFSDGERIIRLVAHHVGAEVHADRPCVSAELAVWPRLRCAPAGPDGQARTRAKSLMARGSLIGAARAFAQRTGDTAALQAILGHKAIAMTMRYSHLVTEHLQRAMKQHAAGGPSTNADTNTTKIDPGTFVDSLASQVGDDQASAQSP